MPAPHHSVFYRPYALPVAQPTASKHRRTQIPWSQEENKGSATAETQIASITEKEHLKWKMTTSNSQEKFSESHCNIQP